HKTRLRSTDSVGASGVLRGEREVLRGKAGVRGSVLSQLLKAVNEVHQLSGRELRSLPLVLECQNPGRVQVHRGVRVVRVAEGIPRNAEQDTLSDRHKFGRGVKVHHQPRGSVGNRSQFRRDLRLPTSVVQRRTVGEADHGDELQPRINLVDDLPLSLRICPAEVDRPSGDEQRCTVVGTGDILGLVQPDSPLDLSGAGVFLSVEALWALSTDYRNTWLMVRVVRV